MSSATWALTRGAAARRPWGHRLQEGPGAGACASCPGRLPTRFLSAHWALSNDHSVSPSRCPGHSSPHAALQEAEARATWPARGGIVARESWVPGLFHEAPGKAPGVSENPHREPL